MALLRYLRPVNGLPDPKGSLSGSIPTQAIAQANREVENAMESTTGGKRGSYTKYSATQCSDIARYACQHGAAAAARYFSKKLAKQVSESTVKSIKKAYIEELRKRAWTDEGEDVTSLPRKKRGRKLLLGEDLDSKVQTYLRKVREGGGAVSAGIVMAAARGILLKCNHSMLADFGGPVELNRNWAHSLLKRMKFVQRKATTSKGKHMPANFADLRSSFLSDVTATEKFLLILFLIGTKQASSLSHLPAGQWNEEEKSRWKWWV